MKGPTICCVNEILKKILYINWESQHKELIQRYNGRKARIGINSSVQGRRRWEFSSRRAHGLLRLEARDGSWICEGIALLIDKSYWDCSWIGNCNINWARRNIIGLSEKCISHFTSRPSNRSGEKEFTRIFVKEEGWWVTDCWQSDQWIPEVCGRAGHNLEKLSIEELRVQKAIIANLSDDVEIILTLEASVLLLEATIKMFGNLFGQVGGFM